MEIFMIPRVDVVTVKSHPPIDNAREIHLEHKRNTLGTPEKYSRTDVVSELSRTPQEPDQHSVDNC